MDDCGKSLHFLPCITLKKHYPQPQITPRSSMIQARAASGLFLSGSVDLNPRQSTVHCVCQMVLVGSRRLWLLLIPLIPYRGNGGDKQREQKLIIRRYHRIRTKARGCDFRGRGSRMRFTKRTCWNSCLTKQKQEIGQTESIPIRSERTVRQSQNSFLIKEFKLNIWNHVRAISRRKPITE